jgi:hypothetical protein
LEDEEDTHTRRATNESGTTFRIKLISRSTLFDPGIKQSPAGMKTYRVNLLNLVHPVKKPSPSNAIAGKTFRTLEAGKPRAVVGSS